MSAPMGYEVVPSDLGPNVESFKNSYPPVDEREAGGRASRGQSDGVADWLLRPVWIERPGGKGQTPTWPRLTQFSSHLLRRGPDCFHFPSSPGN